MTPTATNLTQTVGLNEDQASAALGDIVVTDTDLGETITATLVLSGAGQLTTGTYGAATSTFDAATKTWSVTGSVADVNAALAAVAYRPAEDQTGSVTITTHIEDAAGTGPADGTITLNITAVNDAPEVAAPESIAVTAGASKTLTGIVLSDVDADAGAMTATITVPSGALSATSGGGVTVGGTAAALTLTGTLANLNSFLSGGGVTYAPAGGVTGEVILRVELNDGGNTGSGGAQSHGKNITLEISAPAPDPEPPPAPPPPPPVIEYVDGVPVQVRTYTGPDGQPHQSMEIPAQRPPAVTGNTSVETALDNLGRVTGQIAENVGLKASGPINGKAPGQILPTLRSDPAFAEKFNDPSIPRGLDRVAGADPSASTVVLKLETVLTGNNPPAGPLVIEGRPDAGPAVVTIDTASSVLSQLAITIELQRIAMAFIKGLARLMGGEGPQIVFADDAPQHMVLGEGDDELHGGGGDDVVGSEHGNDSLFGDAGRDTVFGGEGADQLWGGTEADHLHGNIGDDFVHGGEGADTLHGGQGDDVVRGGQDDDVALGDLGADTVFGDRGHDLLLGGEGDDLVHGNLGDDSVAGEAGDDVLHGGQGADTVSGGDGADTLSGDLGDDLLIGGAGADVFRISAEGGRDVIADFDAAAGDRLWLDPGLTYELRQDGADTILDFAAGHRVVLKDVQAAALPDGWIVAG
ncbi:calcium-binding protein [Phenylobacterium zucineum]|uniref:calcium-binding protein n=1 Tax=Phenylobacterium zucineum TaxID=284016 RepID=UPI0003076E2B|nr:calcium-binding protein [Phenylobacterium zucineum]